MKPAIVARVRSICLALPEAYEEEAWVGTRWMVRKKSFAHVLQIAGGWPPAYARAAASDGPLPVVTFRTEAIALGLFGAEDSPGSPFFQAEWGTRWQTKVVGMKLVGRVRWAELEALLVESYRLLAPSRLASGVASRLGPST